MQELINALEECGALRFGDFTLASGAKSDYYIDIKMASTDPKVLGLISRLMAERMRQEGIKPQVIAGVVLGSIPLVTALSLETGIPFVMIRKEKKEHGTSKLIEGVLPAGARTLVVEDVITSAGSALFAVDLLRQAGAEVDTVLSVIDRESGGPQALQAKDVRLVPLLRASQIPR
jgi:orotate phosphoribosyltransferase